MQVAEYIANNDVESVEQVSADMATELAEAVAKIGEKIAIRRFVKYANTGKLDSYIHMGGKIGVIVEMSGNASSELAHDICMQIAAANPSYVNSSEVPKEEIEKEKEILKAQALNEDKPKPMNIIEKMVEGRINKYYKEVCLVEQPFVKDGEKTIKALLKEAGADVVRFTRFVMGEGLEKKEENLADEVQAQINSAKKN